MRYSVLTGFGENQNHHEVHVSTGPEENLPSPKKRNKQTACSFLSGIWPGFWLRPKKEIRNCWIRNLDSEIFRFYWFFFVFLCFPYCFPRFPSQNLRKSRLWPKFTSFLLNCRGVCLNAHYRFYQHSCDTRAEHTHSLHNTYETAL